MFNVLPEHLKKEVSSEYSYRKAITIAGCILFIEACMLILLTPSWLVSSYKERDVQDQIDQLAKISSSKNIDFISLLITSTNAKLSVLDSVPPARLVPVIDKIVSEKGSGIQITQISYSSQKTGFTTIVGGVAASRESLLSFVKTLKDSANFKKVDVPLSNFADDTDIHFTVTLTLGTS